MTPNQLSEIEARAEAARVFLTWSGAALEDEMQTVTIVETEWSQIRRLKATNADLLAALEAITDCYGLGLSPEKFCQQVHDLMMEARAAITKAKL